MSSRSIRISRAGGRPLAGDLHAPPGASRPSGSVLVVHGFKGFKDWGFFPYICDALARRGLLALRFNLSGCGIREEGDRFDDPEGFETNTFARELEDIGTAAAHLRALEPSVPLGLFGHSRGGGMAIVHAARDPSVRALVTWAAIAHADRFGPDAGAAWERGETVPVTNARTGQTFRLRRDFWDDLRRHRELYDLRARAAEIRIPWLLIHGEGDETVPRAEASALYEAARNGEAGELARLLLLPGTGHTFGAAHPFAGAPEALERATCETSAWFAEKLGGAGGVSGGRA